MSVILAVLAAAALGAAKGPEQVAVGDWGARGIRLAVTAKGATFELDCGRGTIDEPLTLDAAGSFAAKGRYVREHGGPVRKDDDQGGEPARYEGIVTGSAMTLRILTGDPPQELLSLTLERGKPGRVFKCR